MAASTAVNDTESQFFQTMDEMLDESDIKQEAAEVTEKSPIGAKSVQNSGK